MAYGTTNGVSNRVPDYDDLIAQGKFTEAMVTEFRTDADGIINARLRAVVAADNIPLSSPPDSINTASDLKTSCLLMFSRIYIQESPNNSEMADRYCEDFEKLMEQLISTPEIFVDSNGDEIAEDKIESTTLDQDRIFTAERTSNGNLIESGTMDKW